MYAQKDNHQESVHAGLQEEKDNLKSGRADSEWMTKQKLAAENRALSAKKKEEEFKLMIQDPPWPTWMKKLKEHKWLLQDPTWFDRGWGFRYVWIDAKPASSGWKNPIMVIDVLKMSGSVQSSKNGSAWKTNSEKGMTGS